MSEEYEENWLEIRDRKKLIVPRWGQPLTGIASLLFIFVVSWVTWQIFFAPTGIFRLYTPLFGFMFIRWILIIAIWQAYLLYLWPLSKEKLETWHPALKGAIHVLINIFIMLLLIYGFFDSFLGRYGIPYFSFSKLTELGNLKPPGVAGHFEPFYAREYVSNAILFVAAIASWLSPVLPVYFEMWPWKKLKQPLLGFTTIIVTFFITFVLFFVLMHPHFGVLFIPWQYYTAAVPAWWYHIAHTLHGDFSVGWVMCCTCTLWFVESIWERQPFYTVAKKQPWRGLITFILTFAMAWGSFYLLQLLQSLWWGPPIEGAGRTWAPHWRALHAGEMMVFFLIAALAITFYFDNWPHTENGALNWLVRTFLTLLGGWLISIIYYEFGPIPWFLGEVRGLMSPYKYPLAWSIWVVDLMLYHNWFFDKWPFYKKAKA